VPVRGLLRRVGVLWAVVWSRRLGIGVAVVGTVAVAVMAAAVSVLVLRGPVEWWLGGRALLDRLEPKDQVASVNSARQIALAAAAGTAALIGLGFTARTYYLSRRGQLTDRYSRAIGQLAAATLTERLGGIYALEHLMLESPRDHNTVVEVLAAFIRETAPAPQPVLRPGTLPATEVDVALSTGSEPAPETGTPEIEHRPATDVQAALTVLARRPPRRSERNRVDLSDTDLRGAVLVGARLRGAVLFGAHLQDAYLVGAHLQGTLLVGADLHGAILAGAHLQGAQVNTAQLRVAHLSETTGLDPEMRNALSRTPAADGAVPGNADSR
jgi:pentapeptide repeat protein